ncbi:MAG: dolichyl-phosphate-mannose--protein mannosyltransferase, partial [Candidatus Beckwithbacteria bacterium]
MKLKNLKVLLPILIFLITFVPRLYRLNNPVADWHSWRQADTAAVARNFVKSDFNLLFPQS